jgi:hypothetical protein
MSNIVLGLDASTKVVGWALAENKSIMDAGFLNISKFETNKEKGKFVVSFLSKHPLISSVHHINLEAALSGFGGGFTSQQTIITLSRWNAILEYILSEFFTVPIILCNVNTVRKKVLGKARIKGINSKEFVKMELIKKIFNLHQFEKLNKKGMFDKHNYDVYDAIIMSLYE